MTRFEDQLTALVLAVFRANGALVQWGDRFAAPFGLTSARWQMLGALALSGQPISAPRIAEAMGVTRQGAQKQLNLLLEEKLVELLPNPASLRSPLYRLTTAGTARYGEIEAAWNRHARTLLRQLKSRDAALTHQVLARLAELHSQASEGDAP